MVEDRGLQNLATQAAEGAQLIPLGLPSPSVRYHCKAALSKSLNLRHWRRRHGVIGVLCRRSRDQRNLSHREYIFLD